MKTYEQRGPLCNPSGLAGIANSTSLDFECQNEHTINTLNTAQPHRIQQMLFEFRRSQTSHPPVLSGGLDEPSNP